MKNYPEMIFGLLLQWMPKGVWAGCPACRNLSVTNTCLNPPDMAAFWQNGQVLNDLGATFGDLHSASNKSIVASGNTNGSVALTFGAASQYVFADFNSYGSCNGQLGLNYDGVHLVVAAQSIGVTFDVKVQMFADDTCTVVDGNKDVVFHSADMNKFTLANQYESFAIPFTTAGINRTRVKDWMITNVQPAGSVLDIGCSSLYQGSVPATGPVDAVIAAESSSSTQAMSTASATSAASQSNAVDSAQNTLPVLSITLGLIFGVVGVYSVCLAWYRRQKRLREEKDNESVQRLSWSS